MMTRPFQVHHTVVAALLVAAGTVWAQSVAPAPQVQPQPQPSGSTVAQSAPSVSTQTRPRSAPARSAPAAKAEAPPGWAELNAAQQQSLAPLSGTWRKLSEAHKRKWLALSANYPTLPAAEQALLHSRMAEWAALSPRQRTQARLNFAETRVVPPTDKKAKWEAYQALPAEEKRKLAAGAVAAKPPPPPTAAAVKPVPQQKMAKIPKPKKPDGTAKIAVVPGQVDRNTLLPQPGMTPLQQP
jgi:hypothetical protein